MKPRYRPPTWTVRRVKRKPEKVPSAGTQKQRERREEYLRSKTADGENARV